MAETPDSLTKALFHERGFRVIKVETWKIKPEIRKSDFLGIFDWMALSDDTDDIFCIQTTSKPNISTRRHKMLSSSSFPWWTIRKNRRSILHGWYKENGRWKVQEEELTMDDWNKYQADKKARESIVDKSTPLYRELFGDS